MTIMGELSHKPNPPAHNPAAYHQSAHKPAAQWCVVRLCEDWLGGDNVMRENVIWTPQYMTGNYFAGARQFPTAAITNIQQGGRWSRYRKIFTVQANIKHTFRGLGFVYYRIACLLLQNTTIRFTCRDFLQLGGGKENGRPMVI